MCPRILSAAAQSWASKSRAKPLDFDSEDFAFGMGARVAEGFCDSAGFGLGRPQSMVRRSVVPWSARCARPRQLFFLSTPVVSRLPLSAPVHSTIFHLPSSNLTPATLPRVCKNTSLIRNQWSLLPWSGAPARLHHRATHRPAPRSGPPRPRSHCPHPGRETRRGPAALQPRHAAGKAQLSSASASAGPRLRAVSSCPRHATLLSFLPGRSVF